MSDIREQRQQRIRQLLVESAIGSQEELVQKLAAEGFSVTQSSLSRDLTEMGVSKAAGRYRLREAGVIEALGILQAVAAGPNLLVLRTEVGAANLVAFQIDQLKLPQIAGTVAGDDTIFIATVSGEAQSAVARALNVTL